MSPRVRKKHDKKTVIVAILSLLLFFSLTANMFLLHLLFSSRKTINKQRQVLVAVEEPINAESEVAGKWYGLCRKNSIHSVEDFHNTVLNDPLLAAHFADFNWQTATMGTLEHSQWTYVTYRKDGRIATTRKQIILPKDDGYITDGTRQVRTYCCNDYVAAAHRNVPFEERVDAPTPAFDSQESVPEPGTLLLFGAGFAALAFVQWGRRHRK